MSDRQIIGRINYEPKTCSHTHLGNPDFIQVIFLCLSYKVVKKNCQKGLVYFKFCILKGSFQYYFLNPYEY